MTRQQPQILIDAFAKTPKDGIWYLAGTDINADTIEIPPTDKETVTVVSWDEGEQDWRFVSFKQDGTRSAGMVNLNATFEVSE